MVSFLPAPIRSACRALVRRPAFTLTAVATLALGVGATTAVFTVVHALLLKPLPFDRPERLVAIWPDHYVANQDIDAIRNRARSFSQVAGFSPGWLMGLTGVEQPTQLNAARVTGNLWGMLGVSAALGRAFGPEADAAGAGQVAVLGHEVWLSVFGGDSSLVGRAIRLNNQSYTVLGVMPPGFRLFDAKSDLYTPLTMSRDEFTWAGANGTAYARLQDGVTVEEASREFADLARGLQREFDYNANWADGAEVSGLQEAVVGNVRLTLMVLLGAVAFLLLIAAANVANLMMVRTAERRHEIAIRTSLGATAKQVAGGLVAESAVLGVSGGVAGVLLAWGGVGFLRRILPPDLPRLDEIAMNGSVLAVASIVTIGTAFLFGIAPALYGATAAVTRSIRTGRGILGGGRRTRGGLVALEVALAVILTVGAALMARTLVSLNQVDPGLRTDHLLTMVVQPTAYRDAGQIRAFWDDALREIDAIPGVGSAGTILHLPTSGRSWGANVEIEGRPLPAGSSPPQTSWQAVSTGYFRTAGVALLAGRGFETTDGVDSPRVLIVNRAFQDRILHGENPLGLVIRAGGATLNQTATIVGVVESVHHDGLSSTPTPEVYAPFGQRMVFSTSLVVRTTVDPLSVAQAVQQRIWAVQPATPITAVRTMENIFHASLQRPRMVLTLLGLFAGTGLLLGAVGIYGVVAFGVRHRMQEIGIRMALGANAARVVRLVVGQGLGWACLGVTAGVILALLLAGTMRGLVFGVSPVDPVSFTLVPVVLLLVAIAASWIPARSAAAADPTVVLRGDG